ncbi:uncharacterized protein LOC108914515, partial [Anoplophora glabripennis]|uniref:uncharacterized protein LOC108914515 n=1 Tax=Anoplophora glabripennis TaxID=217634 RepID=UPI000873F42E
METNVKKYITSLLTSTPLVVTIQQLSKDYKNTIGEPVPYQKLGYNSLEHFLRSIPDTVQVNGSGPIAQVIPVASAKSAHVNQLVTKQKIVKNKKSHFAVQKRTNIYPSGSSYFPNKIENVSQTSKKMYYPTNNYISSLPKYSSYPTPTYSGKHQSDNLLNNYEHSTSGKNNSSKCAPPKDNDVLKNQSNIVEAVKDSNKFEKKILEETPLSSSTSRTSSVAKWVSNSKRIVNDLENISMGQLENSVPIQVRNNLRTLIRQCPEGIWCTEVPEKYRKMFRQDLNYQEFGFKSLIHLCVCLSSIFHYVRPSTEDYKLYDRSRPLPDCAEKTYTMASYSSNSKSNSEIDCGGALPSVDWTDVKIFLPSDIFVPGKEIPRTFVSQDVQENDEIDVVVGEIYDLSKFWVYKYDSQLDVLMNSIQKFYREHAEEYLIPDHLIKEGVYCVQVIFGEYHRALIVDTMPELEDMVRVIFVDYGTMTKVPAKGLCFLHIKFSELEAQAIRCRLANVFPLEEGAPWTREACRAFRKMTIHRCITAKISHINRKEQYLEVYLADVTEEDNSFYINDKLVKEGFAQQHHKERRQHIIAPLFTPIVKYLHLFPTFLELEHGQAPSTAEMEVFHKCNVPINFLYPQYFCVDHSHEETIIKVSEEFHEKYCIKEKRRIPYSQYFDSEMFKTQELDLSIFGKLQNEIVHFLEKSVTGDHSCINCEDFVDADEDLKQEQESYPTDLNLLAEQLKQLNTKEKETVNVLKKDLIVTEDIMKDINNICKFEAPGEIPTNEPEPCHNTDRRSNLDFIKREQQDNAKCSMLYESKESVNCPVVKMESLNDSNDMESNIDLSNHLLCTMTFEDSPLSDEENASNGNSDQLSDHSYDLQLPEVHLHSIKISLLPEDHPLSIINRLKAESELKIQSFLDDELFIDVESNDQESVNVHGTETENESVLQESTTTCTNPFLKDLNGIADTEIDMTKLNPNNPFLHFLQDDDKSSTGSSSSTVYESPIVVTQHSWTSFNDITAETISQLGKSLRSSSSCTSSIKMSDDYRSCSTQTSDQQNKAIQ